MKLRQPNKRKEVIPMKEQLTKHIIDELTDFLGYEPNPNDIDGILENVLTDINERINEYIERIDQQ